MKTNLIALTSGLLLTVAQVSFVAAATRIRERSFVYQYGAPLHSAETALAIAWTEASGSKRHVGEVYQWMSHPIGTAPSWREVRAAATRIGFVDRWRSFGASAEALRGLRKDLETSPVLLRVDRGSDGDRWLLALSNPDGAVIRCLDPTKAAPGRAVFEANALLRQCIAADPAGRFCWLPLVRPLRTAAPPQLTPHSRYEYARKMASVKRRIKTTLVEDQSDSPRESDFTVCVEEPFVVAGDVTPKQMERWSRGTIRWAVSKMKSKYFHKNPEQVLEVWLFNGKESYQRNVTRLFGRKPTTPYGYYSPRHGALVMNIRTGGGTLVHEILHPFMESNFPACPSWFNEGLASLYEQSGERNGEIWGKTNWRLAGLQRAIANRGLPTFEDLCKTTTSEFYDDAAGVHYAQARYLCYYLQEQGKLATYYREFRNSAARDPSGYGTLVKVLGEDDMARFQSQWQQYVMKLRFP